jgi:S1-C subfamily serine protease
VHLVAVVPGGPAHQADLQVGDIVVQAGGLRVAGVRDLSDLLQDSRPGVALELQVLRSGVSLRRLVHLAQRPASPVLVKTILPTPPAPSAAPEPPSAVRRPGCEAYGLVLADVTPDLRRYYGAPAEAGVLVTGIEAGRPAEGDGLLVGDLLVRLDGQPVGKALEVERLLRTPRDRAVSASLIRGTRPEALTLRAFGSAVSAARENTGTAGDQRSQARAALDRALRLELHQLQERIERLKRQLELLEQDTEN